MDCWTILPDYMVQVQGMLRCTVELAPRLGPAMHSLVMLPLSLDAPSPGAEVAGHAKSCWDSDCLGGFSVAAPSLGLADVGPLPGPRAAYNEEELSLQLPPCSLPSAFVGLIPPDPTLPFQPIDAPPVLNTEGAIGWMCQLSLR